MLSSAVWEKLNVGSLNVRQDRDPMTILMTTVPMMTVPMTVPMMTVPMTVPMTSAGAFGQLRRMGSLQATGAVPLWGLPTLKWLVQRILTTTAFHKEQRGIVSEKASSESSSRGYLDNSLSSSSSSSLSGYGLKSSRHPANVRNGAGTGPYLEELLPLPPDLGAKQAKGSRSEEERHLLEMCTSGWAPAWKESWFMSVDEIQTAVQEMSQHG
jgi:hypothetical protein